MGKNQPLNYPYPLILASTSKYRKMLFEMLGFSFDCVSPNIDENNHKNGQAKPQDIAISLATLKAQDVYSRNKECCVIGSDQVCSLGNQILSKPQSKEKAIEQISKLSGKTHSLFTAVTIISPKGKVEILNTTNLTMRTLSTPEIIKYIDEDLPLDCAGSYKLESKGIRLFSKIEMSDHTSIIGLPLIELNLELLKLGYSI